MHLLFLALCVEAVVQLENKGRILHEGNLGAVCHSSGHCPKPSLLVSVEILVLFGPGKENDLLELETALLKVSPWG